MGKNNIYDISLFDGLCGVGLLHIVCQTMGNDINRFIKSINEYIVDISEKNIQSTKKFH